MSGLVTSFRNEILPPDAAVVRVATGANWGEGPVWIPAERVVRWSDIPGNRILQFDPTTAATTVHRTKVEFTNGRTLDLTGTVIQCSHGRRAIESETGGVVTVLADSYNGVRLNSPNDVIVKSDNTIWFTDPPYGIVQAHEGHPGDREYGDNFVFRFDRATGTMTPAITDMEEPNGLAFSPDESLLYVSDTSSVLRTNGTGNRHIRMYDVIDGALCKNGRFFATVQDGVVDGLRVDVEGRVWASSSTGIVVFAPDGSELERIAVPEPVGNLCFGGDDGTDLYIAAATSLYKITTRVTDSARHGVLA